MYVIRVFRLKINSQKAQIDHYRLFIYEFVVFYLATIQGICILYYIVIILTLINRNRFYMQCAGGIICKIIHIFIWNISILKYFKANITFNNLGFK